MPELHIRHLDPNIVTRIKLAAWTRRLSLAQYLSALSDLHPGALEIAPHAEGFAVRELLEDWGLEEVQS